MHIIKLSILLILMAGLIGNVIRGEDFGNYGIGNCNSNCMLLHQLYDKLCIGNTK